MLRHRQGRLQEAQRSAQQALAEIEQRHLWDSIQSPPAAIAQAWVAWERGALTTAETVLEAPLKTAIAFDEVPRYVENRIVRARVLFSQGHPSRAHAELEAARLTPAGRAATGLFADWLALEQVRLCLLQADPSGAAMALPDWRARIERGARSMREHLLLARMAVATGLDATQLLETPPPGLEVVLPHRLELLKLQAIAAMAAGDRRRARAELSAALELAVRSGHRQTFLDDRPALGDIFIETADSAGFELPGEHDIEALTAREMDVLRLLPSHLKYREIAAELYVSVNTVRFHVKTIFRKLGTTDRTATVRIARRAGLLPAEPSISGRTTPV